MPSSLLIAAGAVLAFAQQASGSVQAVYPEQNETWSLEYPQLLALYVEEYYNCLKGGSYSIGPGRTFEQEYRKDIPRCAELGRSNEQEAYDRAMRSTSADDMSRGDVAEIFETVRSIHIARGASLDRTIGTNLKASGDYRADNGQAAVASPEAQACVGRIRGLVDQRQDYAEENREELARRYAKESYSEEDREVFQDYTARLSRFAAMIAFERSQCPAADYVDLAGGASETAASQQP